MKKNKVMFMVDMFRPRIDSWPPDVPYSRQIYMDRIDEKRISELCGQYYNVSIRMLDPDEDIPDGK